MVAHKGGGEERGGELLRVPVAAGRDRPHRALAAEAVESASSFVSYDSL